jgi:hypothetical protein
MKNLYFMIIAVAFFSHASAQSIPPHSKTDLDLTPYADESPGINYIDRDGHDLNSIDFTNQSGDNSIILHGYNILWVFNDVGNRSTNRNANSNNTNPGIESSMVEISVYPVPVKDHLNFSFKTGISSGMIFIYDAEGKTVLSQKFSGDEAIISSADFIPGIYFYQVSENNKSIASGKFIRE